MPKMIVTDRVGKKHELDFDPKFYFDGSPKG